MPPDLLHIECHAKTKANKMGKNVELQVADITDIPYDNDKLKSE